MKTNSLFGYRTLIYQEETHSSEIVQGNARRQSIRYVPISRLWVNRLSSATVDSTNLTLEGEAGANLVGGLVKVLGIEGSSEAEGDTWAKKDVVGEGGNTAVVDLSL